MRRRDERGVILVVVLVFALLLTSTVATFLRKSTLDTLIVRNRDARARADALAHGGIRVATGLILADAVAASEGSDAQAAGPAINSVRSAWARLSDWDLALEGGATLRIHVEDAGAKLNLNALLHADEDGELASQARPLLEAVLDKVIGEMPLAPAEKQYDISTLAEHLIDFVDADDVSLTGGGEDDYYQMQSPPYRAANRPLLSLDELRQVEGFDGVLVGALVPYLTVFPYAGTGGINPNTAPPHVLALLFFDDGVDLRLAPEDTVREILKIRQEGGAICAEEQSDGSCTPIREIVTNAIYPPPEVNGSVFTIVAEARVGDVTRSIEAVVHRSPEGEPRLLSWRVL
ncbi:MAG: type II secretion system minor pseudopilin GspK [Myxococcales bacterium]|nr:type II secretion system minor pseudopilin GspK [Myxococcales bacterium]MDH5307158.1 type II secretion system minor pseudopilin GspK [Myxococcales bacterium]MDH5567108.1 type II secretion system minor pseudopilin GspK [Myxococcales bacterium]